jgi:hypothetical protein
MIDELIDNILRLVHVVRVVEYARKIHHGLLVRSEFLGALPLAELDEALPCLGVLGSQGSCGPVFVLGFLRIVLLVLSKSEENVAEE